MRLRKHYLPSGHSTDTETAGEALLIERDLVYLAEPIHNHETCIVARIPVILPRIAQTRDQEIRRLLRSANPLAQ